MWVAVRERCQQPYGFALSWPRSHVTTCCGMGQTLVAVAPHPPRLLTLRPLAARSAALASGSGLVGDVRCQR